MPAVGDGPEEHVHRGGGFKVAVSEEGVEAVVGAGQGREVLFEVVEAANWAVEEGTCNFRDQFIRERKEWHCGVLIAQMSGLFGARERAGVHSHG